MLLVRTNYVFIAFGVFRINRIVTITASNIIAYKLITHRGRDKMAAILQTTFSNDFFVWKISWYLDFNFTEMC